MIEHPIQQPNNMGGGGSVLSNELVEKAARLDRARLLAERLADSVDVVFLPAAGSEGKQ